MLLSQLICMTLSECSEGCLRCDVTKNKCHFCDISKGFKTLRGKCMKVETKNCAFFNFEGNCLRCEEGFFVDSFTFQCVEIPKSGSVEHCSDYLADNHCSKCESDFYLTSKNTCIEVPSPIDQCWMYRSSTLCQVCNSGYMLSMDFTSCQKPESQSNCLSYSPLKCMRCKSGYKPNLNNYIYELFSFKNRR